jgi:hypothetical protein
LTAVVQPLLPSPAVGQQASQEFLTEDIARCAGCAAYINHLCSFEKYGWACSLCGLQNDYSSVANRRYLGGPEARSALPELAPGVVEALSPVHDTEDESLTTSQELLTTPAIPIVLALVDVAACSEHLELVRSSLMAAVEGLSPDSKFGLIAFGGDDLVLFEPGPGGPCVRHIPLFAGSTGGGNIINSNGPTGAELSQVLPLNNLLTQVQGSGKRAIIAAIEALEPMGAGKRPVGEALQAVLRLLGSSVSEDRSLTGALGARLIMILAGPPNCGRGSVLNSPLSDNDNNTRGGGGGFLRSRNSSTADFNAGAPFLLDPYYPEITAWNSQPDMIMHADKNNANSRNNKYKNSSGGSGGLGSTSNGWTEAAEAIADLTPAAAELGLVDTDDIADVSINWDSACKFYSEAGAAAAALGVVVDLYAVSASFVGLEALRAVAVGSGGSLALYPPPTVEECALTQDLYKRMAEPYAFGCLLRVRTCPELRVVGSDGSSSGSTKKNKRGSNGIASAMTHSHRLRTDPRYSDLFHVACCHPYDAFQLQLEHATRSGFASKSTPVVQLVFQYLCIVPNNSTSTNHSNSGTPTKSGGSGGILITQSVLQRRTRIVTTAFPVAHSAKEVYASVNPQAHTFTLLQYLCNVVAADGIDVARTALLERTVELTAAYHEWITIGEVVNDPGARRREGNMVPVDSAFKACEALQGLPRAAYALLRGPLLGGTATHPDTLCALRTLWDILPPAELATAVYPHLSSWASPDQLAFPRHSLCRAALALSRQPIYLLDAYRSLVVFYASQGHQHSSSSGGAHTANAAPFPPPHHSRLRQHCAALSQARRLTPRITVVREGEPGADQIFGQWLIEDDRGGGAANGATFLDFLAQIKELVTEVVSVH